MPNPLGITDGIIIMLLSFNNPFQELEDEAEQGVRIEYDSDFFEEPPPYDENASFYMMNLSRPLLKAIGALNYVHPTPIQSATIPVALLGNLF